MHPDDVRDYVAACYGELCAQLAEHPELGVKSTELDDTDIYVLLGVGIVFELPVLAFLLSLFGIVTPQFLWKNFRYAILIIAILAAVITPTPDAITMLVFMAPMVVLYFVSIGVSAAVVRRKRRATR